MTGTQDSISADAHLFIEVRERIYRYRLVHAVTSVGSEEDNAVRIRDDSVADHHLLITYVDGDFFLRRVGDSPVQMNLESVENYSEELRYGDVIGMGDVRLRLVEGGSISDVALLLVIYPHMEDDVRPWQVFLSKKTEFTLGEAPADLLLEGSGRTTIENFGRGAQYLVPPKEGDDVLHLNDNIVDRRVGLKDRDVLQLPAHTIRIRALRGEITEEVDNLLWPETMRRFSLSE